MALEEKPGLAKMFNTDGSHLSLEIVAAFRAFLLDSSEGTSQAPERS